jgi:hypothetical protein
MTAAEVSPKIPRRSSESERSPNSRSTAAGFPAARERAVVAYADFAAIRLVQRLPHHRVPAMIAYSGSASMSVDRMAAWHLLDRVRAEFIEMPGLRLTVKQAQRMWSLDEQICLELFEALAEEGFLEQRRQGAYARVTSGRTRD